MIEGKLPIEVPTKAQRLAEGFNRYMHDDREHPAARFWVKDDVERRYSETAGNVRETAQAIGNQILQLVLFDSELEPAC